MRDRAIAVLDGKATRRRRHPPPRHPPGCDPGRRRNADAAADYLIAKAPYLDYPTALAQGLADRHRRHRRRLPPPRQGPHGHHRSPLGTAGAEAVLKLRALRSNGDFDDYWRYHLAQERRRVHQSRYLNGHIPQAA